MSIGVFFVIFLTSVIKVKRFIIVIQNRKNAKVEVQNKISQIVEITNIYKCNLDEKLTLILKQFTIYILNLFF